MHIQIINFNLDGINRDEYETACHGVAGDFASLPGLISKHWLANEENNTYGGVYIWENKEAMQSYLGSDLFRSVSTNPAFLNAESKDFEVIADLSEITRGV